MQICLFGLLSGFMKSSRGEKGPAGRGPGHFLGSKGRTHGGPQGRRTGFRGQMQICLLGLLSGLMKSTGCAPHYPPGPKGSIWGVRNACQSRRKKTCKSIEFEPQKQHLVRNAKRGMLVFPRELSHWALRSPPRDPLTYMQIYDVLAHLGLRNHVFYGPDQNRALPQPPGAPPRPPAPPLPSKPFGNALGATKPSGNARHRFLASSPQASELAAKVVESRGTANHVVARASDRERRRRARR